MQESVSPNPRTAMMETLALSTLLCAPIALTSSQVVFTLPMLLSVMTVYTNIYVIYIHNIM